MLTIKKTLWKAPELSHSLRTNQLVKAGAILIKLSIVLSLIFLCSYELWIGLSISGLAITLYFRKAVLFFFYVLSLDFSLDEDIFRDLEGM